MTKKTVEKLQRSAWSRPNTTAIRNWELTQYPHFVLNLNFLFKVHEHLCFTGHCVKIPDISRHFHNFVQIPDIIRRLEMTFENSWHFQTISNCKFPTFPDNSRLRANPDYTQSDKTTLYILLFTPITLLSLTNKTKVLTWNWWLPLHNKEVG
jgi:hypothetical protein